MLTMFSRWKMDKMLKYCQIIVIIQSIALINRTQGIFADQAGKFDWRQQYVGGIQHLTFDQCGQSVCKRILVGTDQNVVASLSMKSGELVWRNRFETSQAGRIDDMLLVDGNLIVTLGGGAYIRCFNAAVGHLNWEINKENDVVDKPSLLGVVDADDEKVVAILAGNSVYGVDVLGRQQWAKPLANSDTTIYKFLSTTDGSITVIGVAAKSHMAVLRLNAEGTVLSQNSVPATWATDDTKCKFTGSSFACIDPISGILHHLNLQSPESFKSSLLQDVGVTCSGPSFVDTMTENSEGELGIVCKKQNTVMLRVGKEGVKQIKDLPGVNAVHVLKYGESRAFVTISKTKSEECDFRGYDLDTGLELPELMQTVPIPAHHGVPVKLIGLIKRKEASPTIRMMILSQDDSLILFHHSPTHLSQGKLSWVREEALSKVVSVDMVDLPVSPILAKMEDEFGTESSISGSDIFAMFVRRLKTQFSQFQTFLQQLQARLRLNKHHHHHHVDHNIYDSDDDDEDEDYLFRDEFNLKKIIILVTDVGKIYGLYSTTGRILWRHLLPDVVPFDSANKQTFLIFMQRTTAHFPHDPQCTIIARHKETERGVLFRFHPVSGQPLEGVPSGGELLDYDVVQAMMLSQMDDHFLHPIIVLDSQQNLHVYPSSDTQIARNLAPSLFLYTSDYKKAQITGYRVNKDLQAQPIWTVNLGAEGHGITNIVAKRSNEHVHSQGIVLADRSVLYKYLNPNMIVVTTEALDNTQKGSLSVYLLDVVSGQLVFHCNHKKVKGPVHVVHSENWIVYYAWNQRHRRSEVSVLELYEGKKQSNATAFSSLHPPPVPMVLRQSYILSAHISAMEATLTEKGIANKHVLMVLTTGGVLEMPKALLDPRRPEVPTQEHREEGIIPYIPELPIQREAIINYNRSVYNIRGVYTSPAGLESHSMVLAYGLDLFYTRVLPSKMFDVLKEDFDYFFIGSVTLGMIIVSLITKKLAARKALARAWK